MGKLAHKYRVINRAKELGLKLGCWDNTLATVSERAIQQVLSSMEHEADCLIYINRRKHIVEIDVVEGELDLSIMTLGEYEDRYGKWED